MRYSLAEKGITMAKVEEVKKALDVCINQGFGSQCHECVYREYEGGFCIDALMKDALDVINQTEVVHGQWVPIGTYEVCSHCGFEIDRGERIREFFLVDNQHCRWCGAKMDGDKE